MLTALGLMSGTSLDGIDAAILCTDGVEVRNTGHFLTLPYSPELQERLHALLKSQDKELARVLEREITLLHARAVKKLLVQAKMRAKDVDVIGFHGQTIAHAPERGLTWQIGDGALLAELSGIDVINDFRTADVKAGGQGAPLVPLYHAALVRNLPKPIAMLNIGGVANVTYVGESREPGAGSGEQENPSSIIHHPSSILAFDTGSGNALINDWVRRHTGKLYDEGGRIAATGKVRMEILGALMQHEYFRKAAPKSLDRNAFSLTSVEGLSLEDGAATLTAFTVSTIAAGAKLFPQSPCAWYVAGGGRHNREMMRQLRNHLGQVEPVEKLGLNGDALEAEAFAFLAVRSLKGMELSLPTTTGRKNLLPGISPSGGVFYQAGAARVS